MAHADDVTGQPGDAGATEGELQPVLVEMRVSGVRGSDDPVRRAAAMDTSGFQLDASFEPVPVAPPVDSGTRATAAPEATVIVRGMIAPDKIAELEARPDVVRVYRDTPIAPFDAHALDEEQATLILPREGFGISPLDPCDCQPTVAKGTLADVAAYLGVDQIWAAGVKGEGIVIGIVDGGITALGRTPRAGEAPQIPRVIGGWPASDWGTTARAWNNHGNMAATDALGMAPQAQIYDIRLSDGATISNALAGFQWAINQHRADGTPHILSNSWGLYQELWDPVYARDATHPFTRKVVEALDEGMLVLFAAGNCGGACPSSRCGADVGPGRSIWGANGHPRVITVGAVNRAEQYVGYSSQGPAALDEHKPDICSITHFHGYFSSDNGTSAATPVAAGVVALLKQAVPSLTQDQVKQALTETAKDIGPTGWDQYAGAGILQAKAAYDLLASEEPMLDKLATWETLGGSCVAAPAAAAWPGTRIDTFAVGVDHDVYRKSWDGAAWSGWEKVGGKTISAPAAVATAPDRLDLFVLGTDRAVHHKRRDGATWSDWTSLGGTCSYGVAATVSRPNQLDCFTVGSGSQLYHKRWDGIAWSRWRSLGGTCVSAPATTSWGPDRIDVFAVGVDSALYHRWWNGAAWSGWEHLGGVCIEGVAAVAPAPDQLVCFAVGLDRKLYHRRWDGAAWSDWESLEGVCYSGPAAVAWDMAHVHIFAVGEGGALCHRQLMESNP